MSPRLYTAALLLAMLPMTALAQDATAPTTSQRLEALQKLRAACAADVQKHCAGVERSKGALRACLEKHEAALSDGCKAARAERAAARAREKS